ncbi:MAG: acyl-CoA thioesterase [Candidatus Omnitrophica bacterium]|nr:acyl-CoA thioesterase [Candidatus Omnitrophota bacterium]
MFIYKTQIRLHDTDAAGLLFFANQFVLVHDAYEKLLQKLGFGFEAIIKKRAYFLPIVHAESDYKAPLFVGDDITISVKLENLGTTSFIFVYEIHNQRGVLVGTARTVHVTINKKTKKKITLPKDLRAALNNSF